MTLQRVQRVLRGCEHVTRTGDERVACGFSAKGAPILIGERGMGGWEEREVTRAEREQKLVVILATWWVGMGCVRLGSDL